jgi:hypothetical protein
VLVGFNRLRQFGNTGLDNPSGLVRLGGALLGQERDHAHFRQHVLGHAPPRAVRLRLATAFGSYTYNLPVWEFFITFLYEIVVIFH